jgi:tRNA U38,U39,U40 pseudouridine synthase TruA
MPVCDKQLNMRFDKRGSFRCHGNLDGVLTPNGDQALICGEWNLLKQSILLWASTPVGEDIDPKCGCILYKYILHKATYSNLNKLEMELKSNLSYNFPDYQITQVRAIQVYDEDTDTNGLAVSALFNGEEMQFIADPTGLLELQTAMRKYLGTLEWITDAKG